MCELSRVQIVNVPVCFPFQEVTRSWGAADCRQRQRGPADTRSATQLFWKITWDFCLWFVVLKNKKLKKQKWSVAARLGNDFEMGQSWSERVYGFLRNSCLQKWPFLCEIQQPKLAASSKNRRAEESFHSLKALVLFIYELGTLTYWFHTSRLSFGFKMKQIRVMQCFSPITKNKPLWKSWSLFSISLVESKY